MYQGSTSQSTRRRQQIRFGRTAPANTYSFCRTNGCATRMVALPDRRLQCPICLLTISALRG